MVPGFKAKEIKPTKTVGQRLKLVRQKKGLTLLMAERLTKVKLKYLEALEEDRHDLLPTEVYTLGFLRCYGEVLGFNTKKLLDQYRYERRAVVTAKGNKESLLAPIKQLTLPRFLLTPKALFTSLSAIIVIVLVAYIAIGVRGFLAPPSLAIEEPKPDSRIEAAVLTVAGQTDPTVSLTLNGEVVTIGPDGRFKRDIALIPGLNALEFVAINRLGKEKKETRKVLAHYEVQPSPDPAASPLVSPSPAQLTDSNP